MTDAEPAAPFVRLGPERPETPVVLSVPHAGRDYAPELLAAARLPRAALETLEDRLVDRLVWRAVAAGATAFVARTPRAAIDLNRDPREIEPGMTAPPFPSGAVLQSARTRNGLGLIPSRIAGFGAIWRQPIPRETVRERVETVHAPYHDALAAALEETRRAFGGAVLLDCHSMPPRQAVTGRRPVPVVFGDRHGTAAAPDLVEAAVAAAADRGFAAARNAPYAGGHVVALHGRPSRNVHAVQIEIDRSAYLDAELKEPGPGFDAAARLIAAVAGALGEALLGRGVAVAAE